MGDKDGVRPVLLKNDKEYRLSITEEMKCGEAQGWSRLRRNNVK
jgi:hypothetical protein